ncbi:hypothetical protein [Acetobacterium carbinolicum]
MANQKIALLQIMLDNTRHTERNGSSAAMKHRQTLALENEKNEQ